MSWRLEERFVQVFSAGDAACDTSLGSGFILGGGVILTARHVILPEEWNSAPSQLNITARTISAARSGAGWLDADLIWPSLDEMLDPSGRPAKSDVALIRLRSPDVEVHAALLLGLPPSDDEDLAQDQVLNVFAVGFPRFEETPGHDGRRDSHEIAGVVQPYSGLLSDTFKIYKLDYGHAKDGAAASSNLQWKGFSGAALIAKRHVIGVVVARPRGSEFDFQAVRLDSLLSRQDFRDALVGAVTLTNETAAIEVPPIERLVCLLDRDEQEEDFIQAHHRCRSQSSPRGTRPVLPLICLVPGSGEYLHAPEFLIDRFSTKTLPTDLAWPRGTTDFQLLRWPAAHSAVPEAANYLRKELWNELCGSGDVPSDPVKFRQVLEDPSRPRLFSSDLTQRRLDDATARVLADWARFWALLALDDRRPPVHLLFVDATFAEARAWRQKHVRHVDVAIEELTELHKCNVFHLKTWFSDCLPSRIGSRHLPMLGRLETALNHEFPRDFFVKDLERRIPILVQKALYA
jgi:hypothetical protein